MSSRTPVTDVAVAERPAESRRRANRARRMTSVPAPEPAVEQQPTTEQPAAEAPRLNYGVDSVATAAPAEGEAMGELAQPATGPEPGISAEQVAQREAQVAAAQAALDSAPNTPGLMNALADAPPTVKAQVSGELGSRFDGTLSQDSQALQQETPELRAEMQGNTPAPAGQIAAPAADVTLEEAPSEEPAGEELVGEPVSTEEEYQANDAVVGQLARSFSPEGGAKDIDRALDNVQTTDPSIVTSPGTAPAIPLEGATDPQHIEDQISAGSEQAQATLADQQAQVQALPGAERVQLADVHETYPIGELPAPGAEEAPAPEGAQQYLALNQPPEVQTAFDEVAGPAMQESMAQARTEIDNAAQQRDQQHQDAVDQAQRDTAAAEQQARTDQSNAVATSRREIETQRQNTLTQQQTAVTDVEQQATNRSRDDREKIDKRVRDDQAELDGRYQRAETDAELKVQDGERQAEAKRQHAEREAEDQSWWEAALDFITDLFDALVSLINDIFDAVRDAVNAILDAVRDFALALIDLAAGFLKGLISAFGTFLKGLVQGLLGELFPELARKLIGLIDDAVELANSAIDTVANALKTAVNAIVDVLQAGINALLNVFQAAVNIGLGLARAALTGDWGAFIIQLIEAACRVAGLDPQQVFAFIGRTQETIQLIVDNPGQFLSNLVAALTGGIQRFADNFLTHLQAGIIGWLTGALGSAGITLPERFDLIGVISLVAQILGLTWQNLRLRLVRVIGERGVQVLEFVASYLQTLIEGGWSALWERIQNDLAMLRDMVLEQIRNFLVERLIMAAITRLATLFNPVGALVNILLAAYNFYTFIRDQLERIKQVVTTVLDAIGNIARGVLGPAQERVESFLAGLLPLALDLLARLIGLGNVGERVREILQSVQETVWGAIDRLINWVVGLFRGGAGGAVVPAPTGAGSAVQIGERITIQAGRETHTLYIIRDARGGAQEMVATAPMTVEARLNDWESRKDAPLPSGQPGPGGTATPLITQARTELSQVAPLADALARQGVLPPRGGTAPAAATPAAAGGGAGQQAAQVTQEERQLGTVLGQLFVLFGETPATGGTLVQRFSGNIAAAHNLVQPGLQRLVTLLENSLPRSPRPRRGQPATPLPPDPYPDWQNVRTVIESSTPFPDNSPSWPGFRAFLARPLRTEGVTVHAGGFPEFATNDICVAGLGSAIKSRPPPQPPRTPPPADVPDYVQRQKLAIHDGLAPYTHSVRAIRAVIWDARVLDDARETVGGELYERATDPSSRPGADAQTKIDKYKDMLRAATVPAGNWPPDPQRRPPEEGDARTYREAMRTAIVAHLGNSDLTVFNAFIDTPNLFAGDYNRIQGDLYVGWIAAHYQSATPITPFEVVFYLPRVFKADGLRGTDSLLEGKSGDPPIDEEQMRGYVQIIEDPNLTGDTRVLVNGRERPIKTGKITNVIYSFSRGSVARRWYDKLNTILGVADGTAQLASILIGIQPYDHNRIYDD